MSGIVIKKLSVWFDGAEERVNAVKDTDLQIAQGESFGLVGESGSGKSTILRALTGLIPTWSGEMKVAGERLGRHLSES